MSLTLFRFRMRLIPGGLFGFATKTCRWGQWSAVLLEQEAAKTRTDLEDVERLKLYVLGPVPQQVHHHLEIVLIGDVPRHDLKVGSVEKDLAEELE